MSDPSAHKPWISQTLTVETKVPAAAGEPPKIPSSFSVTPGGSAPAAKANVCGSPPGSPAFNGTSELPTVVV